MYWSLSACETELRARDPEQSKTDKGAALVSSQTREELGSNWRVPQNPDKRGIRSVQSREMCLVQDHCRRLF